jgi:hypothetical protein
MSMKNSSDTIGNRTHDLPVCSAVPQQTAPPSDSQLYRCYNVKITQGVLSGFSAELWAGTDPAAWPTRTIIASQGSSSCVCRTGCARQEPLQGNFTPSFLMPESKTNFVPFWSTRAVTLPDYIHHHPHYQ